jgi:L-rhamnose mutarotase
MQRYAFKMFLNPGEAHEYRRRHEAIWPELTAAQGRRDGVDSEKRTISSMLPCD